MDTVDKYYKWPEWMPNPLQEGFTIQPVDTRVKSDMEIGSVVRVEFNTDAQTVSCNVVLDQYQAMWLEGFEQYLLRQGSTWFYFPLWIGGDLQYQLCRMKDRPKVGKVSGLFSTYVFSLDVAERELMPADLVEGLLEFSPSDMIAISNKLHEVMHKEAPGVTKIDPSIFPGPKG